MSKKGQLTANVVGTLTLFVTLGGALMGGGQTAWGQAKPASAPALIAAPIVTPVATPVAAPAATPSAVQDECAKKYLPPQGPKTKEEVYRGSPFAPGEVATYVLYYMGVKVGYGSLSVQEPTHYQGAWHHVFEANASTGDWYSAIFIGKDHAKAFSRASDFAVSHFRLNQDEHKILGKHFKQNKVLEFNQSGCVVDESTKTDGKPVVKKQVALEPGAIDALSAVYKVRSLTFTPGMHHRFLVYTSEKNWWLEAHALAAETVSVDAGTFKTVKLKLKTYLGKELQQRGDLYVWIATEHPQRPVVKIGGEVKIGNIALELASLVAGKP